MHLKATYTLNIFIAYHQKDKQKFDEVLQHLRDLNRRNQDYIINKVWYDGNNWSEKNRAMVKEMTEAADLILLLMSDDSVMSAYFNAPEIKATLALHQKKRAIVVPLILTTCWWEDTVFKHLDVLPRAGLPIYDSTHVKNDLFDQVIEELDIKIDHIRKRKLEIEETFKAKLEEANQLFRNWEVQPKQLRSALPLFKETLELWREGFAPDHQHIEQRIRICEREIDFQHYANAAHEAFKAKDFRTAYFNCKDALQLRNDAIIRHLYEKLDKKLKDEELSLLRRPFDKHLQQGHDYFLSLQWQMAEKEYTLALEFHEDGFEPTEAVIRHKLEICRREAVLEKAEQHYTKAYQQQDYQKAIDSLMNAIKEVHAETFHNIEHLLRIVGDLEHVAPFRDQQTNRWGFYNKKTEAVIIAPKYNAAFNFSENLAGVRKWEKWGFIDIEGNEIIPFIYDFVGHFKNGIVEVVLNRQTCYINHKGEKVDEAQALKLLE